MDPMEELCGEGRREALRPRPFLGEAPKEGMRDQQAPHSHTG